MIARIYNGHGLCPLLTQTQKFAIKRKPGERERERERESTDIHALSTASPEFILPNLYIPGSSDFIIS